jgi:hypothetical protein
LPPPLLLLLPVLIKLLPVLLRRHQLLLLLLLLRWSALEHQALAVRPPRLARAALVVVQRLRLRSSAPRAGVA